MLLDLIISIVVLLGFYLGYSRGLVRTIFDSLSLIIGIVAALKLSPLTIDLLQQIINISPAITFLIGVVLTFVVIMGLIRFSGQKIEDLLKAASINIINKLLGGALQALFFAYLLSMSFWLLNNLKLVSEEARSASKAYPVMEVLPEKGRAVFEKLKPVFRTFWDKTVEAMDKAGNSDETGSQESSEPLKH
jgi:membrane protein required for colicin V production